MATNAERSFFMASRSVPTIMARRFATAAAMLAAALALGGCAAQMAFEEGRTLVAGNNVEAGLVKYQEAIGLDPLNAEYRSTYLQTRDRAVNSLREQGDRLLEAGQGAEAEKNYRRVLAIEPRNDRAQAGLQKLVRDRRHDKLLTGASVELARKNVDAARTLLSTIIGENPKNASARAMLNALEAKPEAPTLEALLAPAFKLPITIDFKEAPLKQVFDAVARSSGLNILFDKDVKLDQKTSIILKNSTTEAAIYFLLMTNQLEQQVMDANTLLIYPNNAGKQKDYQQLLVRKFLLANANAKTVAESLKGLMKMRDVMVDEKLNMIIVRDSPEAIKLAEKMIAMQDVAEPEVMLEVEVLEVSRSRLTELGIAFPGSLSITPLASSTGGTLTVADLRHLNQNTLGATIDPLKINARKVDSDTDILANPRIRVLNREKAKIMIGNRVPSITTSVVSTGIVTESVNYLDVGLKLDVEPTIYLDNEVAIRIGLEVSNIVDTQKSSSGTVTYTIGTRNANTMLRLKDGENQILAGLINDEDRRTANKVPGLGDVPVAGRLFGSTLADGSKSEIVLSITPHLIRNIERPDISTAQFMSGTENNLRRRPDLAARPSSGASSAAVQPAPQALATPVAPAPASVVPTPALPVPAVAAPLSAGAIAPALPPAATGSPANPAMAGVESVPLSVSVPAPRPAAVSEASAAGAANPAVAEEMPNSGDVPPATDNAAS